MTTEFRPYGLFYDALSPEFSPPTDRERRAHTLARLATATCEKGEYDEVEDGMLYYPSWATQSYALVSQPDSKMPFDSQLMISDSYGRWPRQIRFTDHQTNPAISPRKHNFVISGRGIEIIHPLELGDSLKAAREDVQGVAEDFYNNLKNPQT